MRSSETMLKDHTYSVSISEREVKIVKIILARALKEIPYLLSPFNCYESELLIFSQWLLM